jgi:hypothetical protein
MPLRADLLSNIQDGQEKINFENFNLSILSYYAFGSVKHRGFFY